MDAAEPPAVPAATSRDLARAGNLMIVWVWALILAALWSVFDGHAGGIATRIAFVTVVALARLQVMAGRWLTASIVLALIDVALLSAATASFLGFAGLDGLGAQFFWLFTVLRGLPPILVVIALVRVRRAARDPEELSAA